jgi:hypothetical protein
MAPENQATSRRMPEVQITLLAGEEETMMAE